MTKHKPLCFYFPTSALLLDDSVSFLQSINLNLGANYTFRHYTESNSALNEIFSNDQLDIIKNGIFQKFNDDEEFHNDDEFLINFVIGKIQQEVYNVNRFSHHTVVIVDYDIPEMNGVEFCEQLTSVPIKKIMLTGQADDRVAISAFNQGIIDKFIKKESPTMLEDISNAISQAQKDYFHKLSEPLLLALKTYNECIINETKFFPYFEKLCQSNEIIEYYLIDKSGSFLMLNKNGEISYLIVKSESDMDNFFDITRNFDAPQDILTAIKKREKIPVFLSEDDHKIAVDQWQNYLYSAEVLEGNQKYYYSYINTGKLGNLKKEKIMSYKDFLKKYKI